MKLGDRSYYNDSRVKALEEDSEEGFDEKAMTIAVVIEKEDEEEETLVFPAKMEVCDLCQGRGSHVNPSIDSNGLSQEDFDEDPNFREEYMSGVYDVACHSCHGKRVIPVIDEDNLSKEQKTHLEKVHEKQRREAEDRYERRREMMMGY